MHTQSIFLLIAIQLARDLHIVLCQEEAATQYTTAVQVRYPQLILTAQVPHTGMGGHHC